ncbi:MAG: thioredoxin-related protein [Parvicella sp.]|jgi:thioredoxin-related protein
MGRKHVKRLIGLGLFFIGLSLVYLTYSTFSRKNEIRKNLENLSVGHFKKLDSQPFDLCLLKNDAPLILVYFNSECDYCQSEARDLKENIQGLKNTELLMVSAETSESIKQFKVDFQLDVDNIHFARVDAGDIFDTFGSVSVPALFVYDKEGKLVKMFKGKTKISVVLEVLNRL